MALSRDVVPPASAAGVLYEDSRGRLWVGSGRTNAGVALYEPDRDDFTRFPAEREPECLGGVSANAMIEEGAGRLWVGTSNGLCLVDPDHGTARGFRLAEARGGPYVRALAHLAARGKRATTLERVLWS